ncbi:D-glycero-beta-D-manno-heptose-7-phosphate kinase [Paucibacter sp. TC2R-5]|uniref:D-glycero-beta-D-manno-heptose-7-phosphate kinase n=1 Tax=Paucibacter sp. TC2R-5 TaxID=2893555 RepID=UPI0021E46F2E|nr:D-glycero-beta-D-manno-heptose-7-phosphate kinase [Paucibacter sp. TC2R-5]MCV2357946.1 D-glycero-beta-D-manno-heptose-7-phosphate kinase [Paucibacter sp. TC2R-5]
MLVTKNLLQGLQSLPTRELLAAKRVLVVGDVMLDRYWHGAVERISPEAPVPVVRVEREEERLGGAANVALGVKMLGARTTLLTVVGRDQPAVKLRELLHAQGVETVLRDDPKLQTIVKLRVIGRAQQLLRIDFENEPDHELLGEMTDAFEQQLADHDLVLFSDYGKGGLAHIPQMIALARAAGKPVLVDPKGSDFQRYAGATVITPNRAELALVSGQWRGEADLKAKVDALREAIGVEAVLLTRSEEGMTLFSADGINHEPAQAREVFDVTGAGDTVIATLAVMMAAGLGMDQAMRWANRAGGIVVGKFGTATVSYEELQA